MWSRGIVYISLSNAHCKHITYQAFILSNIRGITKLIFLSAQALQCYSCAAPLKSNSTCEIGNLTEEMLQKCENGTTACMVYDTGISIIRGCDSKNQSCAQMNATSKVHYKHCRTCSTDRCNQGSPNGGPVNAVSYSVALSALVFSIAISKLY
ncbi:unnamed protein product [Callosobruchus maculatus]|uniref:UPAR/Ly6 domain-containing protein n=1 Tax=Callosobruchus maculatus TaxID=64391 RepID=A0A653DE92_CALMS|nr:unnamed protein product [Callosobruchus maculatus]